MEECPDGLEPIAECAREANRLCSTQILYA
jgi:hypothetical protein